MLIAKNKNISDPQCSGSLPPGKGLDALVFQKKKKKKKKKREREREEKKKKIYIYFFFKLVTK